MQLSSVLKVQSTFQLSSSHYRPNPLTMKPPAHPCQRNRGGSKNYYSQEPNIQTTRFNSAGKLLLWRTWNVFKRVVYGMQTTSYNSAQLSTCCLKQLFVSWQKKEKTTIWRLFNVVLINLFTNLYLRLPDGPGPGWSPRLNLYWWPSTHPLARALTLHYPEFLGIR